MEERRSGDFYTARGYQLLERGREGLTPSLEDYLEMIGRMLRADGAVRAGTIAVSLNVRPSSVTKMLRRLSELGLIEYRRYGAIRMTAEGEALGRYLLRRHETVRAFLRLLRREDGTAALEEAELVEHCLSRETVERLALLTAFLGRNADALRAYFRDAE